MVLLLALFATVVAVGWLGDWGRLLGAGGALAVLHGPVTLRGVLVDWRYVTPRVFGTRFGPQRPGAVITTEAG